MYPKLILAFTFLAAAAALFTYRQTPHALVLSGHPTIASMVQMPIAPIGRYDRHVVGMAHTMPLASMVRMPTAGAQAEDLLLAERIQMLARRKR